jgi:hypothetical protein
MVLERAQVVVQAPVQASLSPSRSAAGLANRGRHPIPPAVGSEPAMASSPCRRLHMPLITIKGLHKESTARNYDELRTKTGMEFRTNQTALLTCSINCRDWQNADEPIEPQVEPCSGLQLL